MTATLAPAAARRTGAARRPTLGPHTNGRRFAWDEYLRLLDRGDFVEGCRFELGRGILVVSQVANPWHGLVINRIHDLMAVWKAARPGRIHSFLHGSESRLVIPILESDRHPDLAAYGTPPPTNNSRAWWNWAPILAIEVVSPGSGVRDHEEKAEEYLAYGVGEYWIFDPDHPDRPGPSVRMSDEERRRRRLGGPVGGPPPLPARSSRGCRSRSRRSSPRCPNRAEDGAA